MSAIEQIDRENSKHQIHLKDATRKKHHSGYQLN